MTERDAPVEPAANPSATPESPDAFWEDVVEDMHERRDALAAQGWEPVAIHPGDVAVFGSAADRSGIVLIAPDDEFDAARAAVDDAGEFADASVYRRTRGDVVYLVVVFRAPESDTAILVPASYNRGEDTDFLDLLETASAVPIHVRPLDERAVLTFSHQAPELFLPDEG